MTSDIQYEYGNILCSLLDYNQVHIKPEWNNHLKQIKEDFEKYFGLVISTPRKYYWTINKKSKTNILGIKFFKEKETYQFFYLACAFLNTTINPYFDFEMLREKITHYTLSNLPELYESQTPFDEYLIKHINPIIEALKYLDIAEECTLKSNEKILYRKNKPSEILIPNKQSTSTIYRGRTNNAFKHAMNYLLTNTYLYKKDEPEIYDTLQKNIERVQASFHLLSSDYNENCVYTLMEKDDYMMVVRKSKQYSAFPSNTNKDKIISQIFINLNINTVYTVEMLSNEVENNQIYQNIKIKDATQTLAKDLICIGLSYGFLERVDGGYQPTLLIHILKEEQNEKEQ